MLKKTTISEEPAQYLYAWDFELRRGTRTLVDSSKAKKIVVGGLEIDLAPRVATIEGVKLDLTTKEFDVLVYLASRPGTVVSKEELHAAVWKTPGGSEGRTIDVHISTLRKKLGEKADDKDRYLHTSIGAGVKLESPGS